MFIWYLGVPANMEMSKKKKKKPDLKNSWNS